MQTPACLVYKTMGLMETNSSIPYPDHSPYIETFFLFHSLKALNVKQLCNFFCVVKSMKFLKICPSYAELSPANVNKPRDNAPLQKGNHGDRKFNDNENNIWHLRTCVLWLPDQDFENLYS